MELGRRVEALELELQHVMNRLAAQSGLHVVAPREHDLPRVQHARSRKRSRQLRDRRDPARPQHRQGLATEHKRAACPELDGLRSEVEALRDRLRQADLLEETLRAERAEAERLRAARDEALRQVEALSHERDRLVARLLEIDRLAAELSQARQEAETAAHQREALAERVRALTIERDRQKRDHEEREQVHQRCLAALRREWEAERRTWHAGREAASARDAHDRQAPQGEHEPPRREAEALREGLVTVPVS